MNATYNLFECEYAIAQKILSQVQCMMIDNFKDNDRKYNASHVANTRETIMHAKIWKTINNKLKKIILIVV